MPDLLPQILPQILLQTLPQILLQTTITTPSPPTHTQCCLCQRETQAKSKPLALSPLPQNALCT